MCTFVDKECVDLSLLGSLEGLNGDLSFGSWWLNSRGLDYSHVLVQWGDIESLDSQSVFSNVLLIVRSLVADKVRDYASACVSIEVELELSAARALQPRFTPLFKVQLQAQALWSVIQLGDEVLQLRVLKPVLLEVSLEAFLKDILTDIEDHLMQESSTFTIADTIKDILCNTCSDDICSDRVRCILLVFSKSPILFIQEDVPGEIELVHDAITFIHCHIRDHICEGLI